MNIEPVLVLAPNVSAAKISQAPPPRVYSKRGMQLGFIHLPPRPGPSSFGCAIKNSRGLDRQSILSREKQGPSAKPTLLIVDAQSVKNTDTAGSKGYDAGEKVSGIKRHIGVDTQGLPHAIAVTTAEVTDRKGALQAMQRGKAGLDEIQSVLADSGYVGKSFAQSVPSHAGRNSHGPDCQAQQAAQVRGDPKRWVVERSFAWLEKNRRLWTNCERWLNTSLQYIHLAFLGMLCRRSGTRSKHHCKASHNPPAKQS